MCVDAANCDGGCSECVRRRSVRGRIDTALYDTLWDMAEENIPRPQVVGALIDLAVETARYNDMPDPAFDCAVALARAALDTPRSEKPE